ncbi:hypothetical protein ZIOFF_015003 [Zingiber officinale]|uniref:Uncharacterized protein n=1 Tax=Zingiber officinale TaxID=94328 RepID=A0A8J5HCF9_ZINOF|nr:hypothetical protein ZIOFF_015003 [Zingiber officinale]
MRAFWTRNLLLLSGFQMHESGAERLPLEFLVSDLSCIWICRSQIDLFVECASGYFWRRRLDLFQKVRSFDDKIRPLGMETVFVVGPHRSKYHSRGKSQPSRDFGGFSCRTFESAARVMPSSCSRLSYCYGHVEPKSPSYYTDQQQKQRRKRKTISLNTPPSPKGDAFSEKTFYSERWAGPAYSNSPPPSSLPIPTFSLRQKRSVSLELQIPKSDVVLHSLSKSAPSSPTRESPSSAGNFLFNTTIATENLRRILQLDIADG